MEFLTKNSRKKRTDKGQNEQGHNKETWIWIWYFQYKAKEFVLLFYMNCK